MSHPVRSLLATLLLVITLAPAWSAPAADPKKPDPDEIKSIVKRLDEEPERVLHLARTYQDDPYADRALTVGALLTRYMMETSKVTITIDTDVIAPLLAEDKSDANMRILFLYTNSLLVYAIGHGNKAGPTDEAIRAGLDGVVAGYRNMLKARPQEHNKFADQILALADKGELDKYIRETRGKAPKPSPSPQEAPKTSPQGEDKK